MIEVSGLTKRYGNVNALTDVSFAVEKGKIVGFLGANGAGKTTTMDIVCGCIGADAGRAVICGFDITEEPLEAKKRLGYLPDVPPLHPEMRVNEFIEYSARLHKVQRTDLRRRVESTMEKLSLGDVRERIIGNLSKGFRQRVALAQAIVHEPDVLILDEPTEGLDPVQIVQIRELIRSLAGDHTIVLSSHILSEVQNTCDQIVIIHKGRIIRQGSYSDLVAHLQAGQVYRMRVARGASNLVSDLSRIDGIVSPRPVGDENMELEFALKSDGECALDEIAKITISGGFGLRELAPKTKTLEEVFFQITK